jgi:hypothetical protein
MQWLSSGSCDHCGRALLLSATRLARYEWVAATVFSGGNQWRIVPQELSQDQRRARQQEDGKQMSHALYKRRTRVSDQGGKEETIIVDWAIAPHSTFPVSHLDAMCLERQIRLVPGCFQSRKWVLHSSHMGNTKTFLPYGYRYKPGKYPYSKPAKLS